MTLIYDDNWLWMVVIGFIVAFILAFGIGANDVANSFGTSVGAKVLTIRQACILGTIFEILGAILVGAKVSNTIRKGIISPDIYSNGTEDVFIAGNLAALSGSCIWLMVATFLKLPVSGTHSIVGATIGFSIVVNGVKGIGWAKLGMIAGSWFISPIFSGLVSSGLFKLIDILILRKDKPLEPGLRLLPICYAVTFAVNLFSVFYKGSQLLHFHKIPLYGTMILTFGPAILVAIGVRIFLVPRQRKKIQEHCNKLLETEEVHKHGPIKSLDDGFDQELLIRTETDIKQDISAETDIKQDISATRCSGSIEQNNCARESNGSVETDKSTTAIEIENDKGDSDEHSKADQEELVERAIARNKVQDKPETAGLFTFLQILTAVFGSFAHGGNDVSNAIGPLVALWITATTGSSAQKVPVPIWVLVYGGVGISVGLWIWGRGVMKTIADDLTKITPSSGFCIEVGSALTVIIASNAGIPISTTHCKVGSVVTVGRVRSRESVDWKLFRNIFLAWIVTLPMSGALSALIMFGLKSILDA